MPLSCLIKRLGTRSLAPLALFSVAAAAQVPAVSPPPSGAPARPATLQYQSPLSNYRKFDDQAVLSWREANDRVGQIGGWRVYAKEAAAAGGGAPPRDGPSGHHGGGAK